MTLEQRVTDAGGMVRSLNSMSHADQLRLADRLGVHVTDLHRRAASHHSVAAARAELEQLKRGPRRSTPAAATARRSTSPDEEAVAFERQWFAQHPGLLKAMDYVSERVGLRLPTTAAPGHRLLAVIKRVDEVGDEGRRDALVSMIDGPLDDAVRQQHELEDAHRSLARQAHAVLAAGKRGLT
jgi:hypothetical protein